MTQPQTRILLKPLASPSILGMAAFFGGIWTFATFLCGWYHQDNILSITPVFIALYSGLAQFIAGFYGFPARDNFTTVFHVSWGSFYLLYGMLYFVELLGDQTNLPTFFTN
jgi:uncharacterized protein